MISMDNFWNDLDDAIAATNGMETKSAKTMMAEFFDDHRGLWPHIEADIAKNAEHREIFKRGLTLAAAAAHGWSGIDDVEAELMMREHEAGKE